VPAAAVIPAPRAYIKVAVFKKLVVKFFQCNSISMVLLLYYFEEISVVNDNFSVYINQHDIIFFCKNKFCRLDLIVRGGILGLIKDIRLRKRSSNVILLIKSES
jgi:hypothetical protein